MKKILWFLLIIIIILLLLWWWHERNEKREHDNTPLSWRTYIELSPKYVPADSTQQIIVWRIGGDGFFDYWLDSVKQAHPGKDFKITVMCNDCDSSLLLLSGEGIRTFIQSGGGTGGGSTCTIPPSTSCSGGGPHGGGDTVYWCMNYPVEFKDSLNSDSYPPPSPKSEGTSVGSPVGTDTAITVAVFDTGIDTVELNNYLYRSNELSCLGIDANNGWNFIAKNNNVQDDYISNVGHGQVVARLIADQVNHYGLNKVKILPVKTHAKDGKSDLFSILCGFAYAQKRNAKIINASFGYYSVKPLAGGSVITDPGALLLKQYIKFYLTNNNIWLIAAAGNRNSINSVGDLDQVNFYPASLAADPELPNVIAVTTVDDRIHQVSDNQNYSANVVDVGVNDDVIKFKDFWFFNPRQSGNIVKGSSYATPIVTGTICAHYDKIMRNVASPFNKTDVLNFLLKAPVGHVNAGLNTKIKLGRVMFK